MWIDIAMFKSHSVILLYQFQKIFQVSTTETEPHSLLHCIHKTTITTIKLIKKHVFAVLNTSNQMKKLFEINFKSEKTIFCHEQKL